MPYIHGKYYTCGESDIYYKWHSKPNVKCAICGIPFYVKPERLRRLKHDKRICCSKQCGSLLRKQTYKGKNNPQYGIRGKNNASYRDEKSVSKYGYIEVIAPVDYPFKRKHARVFEHRLIVEENYKRFDKKYFVKINNKFYLKPEIDVHHINEIRTDNRIENLIPLTRSEHRKLHDGNREIIFDKSGKMIGMRSRNCILKNTNIWSENKMNNIVIKFKKLNENAVIPAKTSSGNAGFDFYSPINISIKAHTSEIIDTGIAWQPNTERVYMQLKGRSGLCFKNGIELCNAGVIDPNYTGNICIKLFNTSDVDYRITKGDRICQGIIFENPEVTIIESDTFFETDRGNNGFGSSGK